MRGTKRKTLPRIRDLIERAFPCLYTQLIMNNFDIIEFNKTFILDVEHKKLPLNDID